MADLPISDFPSLTGANVAVDDDTLAIVDASAVETKRISVKELVANTLSFTQSGAGAIARTVEDKERDIVSVFDWFTPAQIADVQVRTALVDVTIPLNND